MVMMSEAEIISIVDDDASIRQALDGLLRSIGLRAATFASAEEFLGSEHRRRTACLILDLRMPRLGGRELQEKLVHDGYQIPVIILTAHGNEKTRAWASRAGVVAFLHKPFDTETLLGAVESALNR